MSEVEGELVAGVVGEYGVEVPPGRRRVASQQGELGSEQFDSQIASSLRVVVEQQHGWQRGREVVDARPGFGRATPGAR